MVPNQSEARSQKSEEKVIDKYFLHTPLLFAKLQVFQI